MIPSKSRPQNKRPFRLLTPILLAAVALSPTLAVAGRVAADTDTAGKLRAFFIDVEGGQATLFITPSGQSLLIDTGWDGNNGRDADRIVAIANKAGLRKIDFVLITHFHEDHVGGVAQLLDRIPVGAFIDHGENREFDHGPTERLYADYEKILATGKSKHILAKPGDRLPIQGVEATVISADGVLLQQPLPNAGRANETCSHTVPAPADQTENARSVGILLHFGVLTIVDLGDLTKDKERDLVCPVNKLGRADIYIVSHHGWNQSSSPEFVDALHARVAIMDNGAKKGGSLSTLQTLRKAPGLETLWQVHFSDEGGPAYNTGEQFIANLPGPDAANSLELIADPNGSFDVLNSRNNLRKHYPASSTHASSRPAEAVLLKGTALAVP